MVLLHVILLAIVGLIAAFAAAWISHAAKISEFRLSWIDGLRQDIADYVGLAEAWLQKWAEINPLPPLEKSKREREELFPLANEARVTLGRIRLGLNPDDNPSSQQIDPLLLSLEDLLNPAKLDTSSPFASWQGLVDTALQNAKLTLKNEWEVAKKIRWPSRADFRR
jgi:hypothetical protein